MGIQHMVYPRPTEEFIYVKKEPVDTKCPNCGSANVKKYPIIHHTGPRTVVKCQDCFHRLDMWYPKPEEMWPPFRPATEGWSISRAG